MSSSRALKITQRRHPMYDSVFDHWVFLEKTYVGGRQWFSENIFRYMKEGNDEFKERIKRAYRFNHTREVVDLVNKYLFRAKPVRNIEDAPECVNSFWRNVDGSGLNMDEFAKSVSTKTSISGCPWVIVDNRQTEVDENANKGDDEEGAIYAYIVLPQNIRDMSWGEDGRLNWLLVREVQRDDSDPFESTGKEFEQYRLWTRETWVLFKPELNERGEVHNYKESEGHHGLGRVPAIRVTNSRTTDKWVAPALINDIAYLDRAVANYLSNLDAIIQDQAFSQLAMPAQNVLPGEDGYNKIVEMGTKRIFLYDGESGTPPGFISPDPKQAQLIITAIQQIINEIYHSVGLAGERTKQDNSKGIDNSSGVAKSMDFERVNSLLISKADAMELFENELVELVALWNGEPFDDPELVKYPETFDVRGLFDEFDIAMQLSVLGAPGLVSAAQLRVIIKKMFPASGERQLKEMLDAVEEWQKSIEEERDFSKQARKLENQLIGEAQRDRNASGGKQSRTKKRRETGTDEAERQAEGVNT